MWRQWRADMALRSLGSPETARVVQRQFWRLIATGVSTAEAVAKVGVSVAVGLVTVAVCYRFLLPRLLAVTCLARSVRRLRYYG